MSLNKPDFSLKIVLTGNSGVGKTNFLTRFDRDQFNDETKPTIGVEFASKTLEIKGKFIKAQIWDTSGQEKFNTITTAYYRGAIGAILFYDITDQTSFDSISRWLQTLRKDADSNSVIMLVGNKCDLENKRQVTTEQGEDFAKRENLLFTEASALNSTNVEEAFTNLFSEIVNRLTSKKGIEDEKLVVNEENSKENKNEEEEEEEKAEIENSENKNQEVKNEEQTQKDTEENVSKSFNNENKEEISQDDDKSNDSPEMVHLLIQKEKITEFIQYVRLLESKLSKYEEVDAFDFQIFMSSIVNENEISKQNSNETKDESVETHNEGAKTEQQIKNETVLNEKAKAENETNANENIFITEDDEKHQKIQKQIGEGASSIAYKVVDTRDSQIMCKKILKTEDTSSDDLIKEFEVLHRINHPCICKMIGINPKEKAVNTEKQPIEKKEGNEEEEEFYETVISKPKKIDENKPEISLFVEYLDFSLKSCLENDILSNTMKTKIALEVAFGMSHLHKLGMIHRDLSIDNIMLNSGFEAKIINFGLIHHGIDEMLTRDIGGLAYMSPELQNEDEYDNKTDVYSFGVVLYAVFTGKLPKQKMKDKLNKVPPHFPKESPSISNICIELIKKCMSFEAQERPSFDNIIEYMNQNSFKLANEVDYNIVSRRYHELISL